MHDTHSGKRLTETQAENVHIWVTAMKSGDYVQTPGKLCAEDESMCCLGVAADVLIDDDWELIGEGDETRSVYKLVKTGETSYVSGLCKLLGIRENNMLMTRPGATNIDDVFSITCINDNMDKNGLRDYSNVLPHIVKWYNRNRPENTDELV